MHRESTPTDSLLEALVERSQVGICAQQDGVFIFVNSRFAEMFGYAREEMIGRLGAEDVVDLADGPDIDLKRRAALRAMVEEGEERTIHVTCGGRTKSGEPLEVEVFSTVSLWEGTPTAHSTVIDITARRAAEKTLEESRRRYRDLVELVPAGIAVYRNDGIVFMNKTGAELLGAADPEELVGRQPLELLHPDDREMVLGRVREMAKTGRPAPPVEERFLRLDARVIDVEATAVPVTYEGEPATLVHFRDITERKEAERALREAEERFRLMCEHFPIGIAISREGRTVYANDAYVKMFGFDSLSNLQGTPILDQIAPSKRREISERLRRRARGDAEPTKYETSGLRKDGTEFPFLVQLAPIELADGPANAGFFVDVTERRQLEEGLRAALAELEKLQRKMRALVKNTADAQEKERLYLASEIHDDFLQGLSSASYFLHTLDVSSLDVQTRETREKLLESVSASLERGRALIDEIRPVDAANIRVAPALQRSVGLIFSKDGPDVEFVHPKRMPRLKQHAEQHPAHRSRGDDQHPKACPGEPCFREIVAAEQGQAGSTDRG